jgi:hypothetical protein
MKLTETGCTCERKFQSAFSDIDRRARELPHLAIPYLEAKLDLQRIHRAHFRDCKTCQQEDSAAVTEAA